MFCTDWDLAVKLTVDRNWRDPSWTGLQAVRSGLPGEVQQQRLSLFGPNVIDIEGKSTITLLIDEVFFAMEDHPV